MGGGGGGNSYTRSVTLQKHSGQDSKTLVSSFLGYKEIPDNAALKHGRSMEIHAKQKYIEINKRKHRNLKSEKIGLVVMKTKPYIAVSQTLKLNVTAVARDWLRSSAHIQ